MPSGVLVVDGQGLLVLANAPALALIGLPDDSALAGRGVAEILRLQAFCGVYGPGDPEELAHAALAVDRARPTRRLTRHRDGRWFELASSPLPGGGWVGLATDLTAQRRAEQEALGQLRRMDAVMRMLPVGFGVYDAEHRLALFNAPYERILELPPGTLRPGLPFAEVAALIQQHQPMTERDLALFAARLGMDRRQRHESIRQRPDGRAIRSVSLPLAEGGFLVSLEDVTPLRAAENEAKHRAALLDGVLAALPHGVCVYDAAQRVRLVNAAHRRLIPEAEARPGDHLRDLVHRVARSQAFAEAQPVDAVYRRQLDFGSGGTRRVRRDGRALSNHTAPLPDGGHVAVISDITALHRAEQAAQQRAALLQAMVDSMRHGVCLFDSEHRVVLANALAARLTGLTPEEMAPGTPIERLRRCQLERGEFGEGEEARAFYAAGGDRTRRLTDHYLRLRPDGTAVEVFTDPTPDGGYVRVYADVTEAQRVRAETERARAAAEEADAAKSRFLATMSHELRTPLNAVIGFSEALAAEPGPPHVAEFATAILEAGRHLLSLIDEILEVARTGTGAAPVETRPLYLPSVLEGVARLLRQGAEAARLSLQLDLPANPLPRAMAEERRLRQVLINLLSNAVKFTPAGGSIRLGATPLPEGGVEIHVRDTGIGIAPEQLERAFEPFVQLETTHARRYSGSGLGLYLARALAQSMGALLTLESRPGEGTTARLRLPGPPHSPPHLQEQTA
nr:PAS domain-containing sensor histidine kinase [Roseomonas sp. GC11]